MAKKPAKITVWKAKITNGFNGFILEHEITNKIVDRIYNKVKSEFGWIEDIIKHQPTIGGHYENIIKNAISEFTTSNTSISGGFIIDDKTNISSPQNDLILYDTSVFNAVIYKNDNFAIVRQQAVQSVVEIKKNLLIGDLRKLIHKYFESNCGSYHSHPGNGIQFINVFSYLRKTSIKRIFEVLVYELNTIINGLHKDNFVRPVRSITLPKIYFLDSNEFISCSFEVVDTYVTKITCNILKCIHDKTSIGEFISALTEPFDSHSLDRINYLSIGIFETVKEVVLDKNIIIRDFISCSEITKLFTRSDIEISKKSFEKIVGFHGPKELSLKKYSEVISLIKSNVLIPVPLESNDPPLPSP